MPSLWKTRPRRDRLNDASLALFIVAWLAGLAYSINPGRFGFGHGFEMASIAKNLVERNTFGNPFDPALTGPTAALPPLYPMFLAFLIRVFGWPLPSALIASIGFNAVTAGLMPRLAKAFFQDMRPGLIAGCLWIAAMPMMPQWDISFTVAALALGCVFTSESLRREDGSQWLAVGAGAIGGIVSLLNPVATIVFLLWVGYLILFGRAPAQHAVRYFVTVAAVIGMCNAPWLLRNYRLWHAVVLRTNFGMTVYSSNNDCAAPSLSQSGLNGCYQRTHPIASEAEVQLIRQLGEVEYDRRRTADTVAWVRSHPGRFGQLTGARIVEFWFPDPTLPGARMYLVWAVTLLSVPGMIVMFRHRETVGWLVLAIWLIYPLTYYVVVSADRYRYPILWTSLLPAGYYLAGLWLRWQTMLYKRAGDPVPQAAP